MVSLRDIENVLVAIVPLYVAMLLGYVSMKLWKLFTLDQCSGINKFVVKISVPLLSFHVISSSNPYKMNIKLILADTVQKIIALLTFTIIDGCILGGKFNWLITGFSLSTLPNSLIIGIPLVKGMYGEEMVNLMGQIVVLQTLIWNTLLLFLFELRAAEAVTRDLPNESTGREFQGEQHSRSSDGRIKVSSTKKKTGLILLIVLKKLMTNPNTYASFAGLGCAFITFRWGLHLPVIVENSISIVSDGGLGMAMFSLGLFIATQSKFIACGKWMAALAIALRFLLGPGIMSISSYALGMRGKLLKVAILQAGFPQGIVPFVFAKEYELHPDILSTGITLGMILAVPMALAYYYLLEL